MPVLKDEKKERRGETPSLPFFSGITTGQYLTPFASI